MITQGAEDTLKISLMPSEIWGNRAATKKQDAIKKEHELTDLGNFKYDTRKVENNKIEKPQRKQKIRKKGNRRDKIFRKTNIGRTDHD